MFSTAHIISAKAVFGNSKYLRRRRGDDKTVPFWMLIEYNRVRSCAGLERRTAWRWTRRNWLHTLTKSSKDKWIGGVCGGLGEHTPSPVVVLELLFAVLSSATGRGCSYISCCGYFFQGPDDGAMTVR